MPELTYHMKQAYIFDQELSGFVKNGEIANVKEVLKQCSALKKAKQLSPDEADRVNIEIALIFYRSKDYDHCLRWIQSKMGANKEQGWQKLAMEYVYVLCLDKMGKEEELLEFASNVPDGPYFPIYKKIFQNLEIYFENWLDIFCLYEKTKVVFGPKLSANSYLYTTNYNGR